MNLMPPRLQPQSSLRKVKAQHELHVSASVSPTSFPLCRCSLSLYHLSFRSSASDLNRNRRQPQILREYKSNVLRLRNKPPSLTRTRQPRSSLCSTFKLFSHRHLSSSKPLPTPTTQPSPSMSSAYPPPDPRGHLRVHAYTTSSPSLPPTNLTADLVPIPKPLPNEVLVKISHASLSPGAVIMQALFPAFAHTYPSIPELDFSGRIVSLGPPACSDRPQREFVVGDLVFGSIPVGQHLRGCGALAEYVALPADCVARIPDPKSFAKDSTTRALAEASSLPVSGCTALSLFKAAQRSLGDGGLATLGGLKVLVNGASGGVGSLVVQMAKHAVGDEGSVTAVCSEKNRGFVEDLGADEVVSYDGSEMAGPVGMRVMGVCIARARKLVIAAGKVLKSGGGVGDVSKLTKEEIEKGKFDVVIDAVGKQEIWYECEKFLKREGAYVTVGPGLEAWTRIALMKTLKQMAGNMLTPRILGGVGRRYIQVASTVDKKGLLELKKMVEEGKLKGVVEKVYKWDEIEKAYEVMLSRRARGKIVVKVEH